MEKFIGEIALVAFGYAPPSHLPCDGRLLPIADNGPLYSLLGNRYGGDGHSSFGLPDLKGKEPLPNLHYVICVDGVYPMPQ